MENVIDVLKKRGFIEDLTHDTIDKALEAPTRVYCGFDPTGDSLHLGNMVAMMGLAWFQRFGHTPVVVLGGATGMIGDPSGKAKERQLLDHETLEKNIAGIRKNFDPILDFSATDNAPIVLNNLDWFQNFSIIDFLRDVGKHFRLGPMLGKESVKTRLNSEEGMSYTEFSYQLMQGYDFLHLFRDFGVTGQMGGSDQWGNITAGIDLIRKVDQKSAFGLTFPLLTTSDGKKFGKSEAGAIWLSPEKLSPYQFYQYLVRTQDADVICLMKMLTFMDLEEIDAIEKSMKEPNYKVNSAQKRLAEEVTRLVHGQEALETAIKVTQAAAPGKKGSIDSETLQTMMKDLPTSKLSRQDVLDVKVLDLIVKAGLQSSKGQGRRLIQNGGFYLNNEKVLDENYKIEEKDLLDGQFMLLAFGKKNKTVLQVLN